MHPFFIFVLLAISLACFALWRSVRQARRAEFIRSAPLPKGLYDRLMVKRPALNNKDCQLVAQALRQFFLAYLKGGRRTVAMPSQVADELWHEFILHTRAYQHFCRHAFGRFMHHTPAAALGSVKRSNEGLRRCWWWACKADNINPRSPARLPLLFAIDHKLQIAGGFHYVPDCGPLRSSRRDGKVDEGSSVVHCGGDFADGGFDGGTDGFGDGGSSNSSSDGGSDGGGDSGCSGGGCSSD